MVIFRRAAFGNRWTQSVTGQTAQSYNFASSNNRMTGYSYDAAGNLMVDPQSGITYTYDDENRVIQGVQSGATVAQYWYDAEGQRVRKISSAGTEEYVYDKDGHQVGGMQPSGTFNRIELYAGNRHLATYDGKTNATYFIHDDWQGTERVRSSYAGGSYETCTNLPYGDQQACTGATDPSPLHYTGKMRDIETGLDYFGARYYSNGMGHWMSPDWADKPTAVPYANFGDPQSLNLYGMVTGNPVSKQDSDGHKVMDYLTGFSNAGGNGFEGDSNLDSMVANFAAPTADQQPNKPGGFWQKLKNWATGNGWQTDQQVNNTRRDFVLSKQQNDTQRAYVKDAPDDEIAEMYRYYTDSKFAAFVNSSAQVLIVPDLLNRDATGRIHGELPDKIPDNWTQDDLAHAREELQQSIKARTRQAQELGGPDAGHMERIRQEQQLLRQIEGKLGE